MALYVVMCASIFSCNNEWFYNPEKFITPDRKVLADFALKPPVQEIINKENFKIAFCQGRGANRKIAYVDYSSYSATDSLISAQSLRMPIEQNPELRFPPEAPVISPDGKWVTYFLTDKDETHITYIQKLDTAALPVKMSENAAHPHWWEDTTGSLFIVYCNKARGDVSKDSGYTKLQQVNPDSPVVTIGEPVLLANDAFNGGLSKDGRFLCTGDYSAHFYDRTDSTLIPINPDKQACNGSISPDTGHKGHRMMFLNIGGRQNLANDTSSYSQHEIVYIVNINNESVFSFNKNEVFSESRGEWQDPEWSNHPDYFIVLSKSKTRSAEENTQALDPYDCYVVTVNNTPETVKINNDELFGMQENASPYLWIDTK